MTCELHGFYWWGHATDKSLIANKLHEIKGTSESYCNSWGGWDADVSIPVSDANNVHTTQSDDGELLWSSLR
jgi:hypothetical protein